MNCDPQSLVAAANCFKCIPAGMHKEVETYLLCQIANASSAGGGSYGFITAFPPTGAFAALLNPNVYAQIQNYNTALVSGQVSSDILAGNLIVSQARVYRASFSISSQPDSGNQIECDIAVNGTASDVIAAHTTCFSASRDVCMSGTGIMSLNAGDVVSLVIKNLQSTHLAISHCQLTLGTP